MSFLPRVLLRYHSYMKERTLVPLSPLFSFRIRHYPQWSDDFLAHSDTLCSYMQEMIPGHLTSSSLSKQAPYIHQMEEKTKALKSWKDNVWWFLFSNDTFLYYVIGLSLETITSLPSRQHSFPKLLSQNGKHLKFWSMTFQLRKWSPSSFLLQALHAPGNGRAKIPGWFPWPLGLNIPCLKSLPNLYTSYD